MEPAADFFRTDTPHGYAKRFMWMRYLQAFVAKTQNYGYKTLIYDGFAGAGVYSNAWEEDIAKYGSPLIALRVAIHYFIQNEKLSIRFTPSPTSEVPLIEGVLIPKMATCSIQIYLVEANTFNFKELVKNILITIYSYNIDYIRIPHSSDCVEIFCNNKSFSIGCRVLHNNFKDVNPPLVGKVGSLVSFIDPFDYKDIPMSHDEKFLGTGKEIYINFMSQPVNRFFDFNEEGMQHIFEMNKAKIESRLLNYKPDRLDNCVSLYKDVLKEYCKTDAFALSFEKKNKHNTRLYHLMFISCHEKGFETMKEAMNRGSHDPNAFTLSDFSILVQGREINLKNGQVDDDVDEVIFQRFKGSPQPVSIDIVRNFVLYHTTFVWRKRPLKVLCKNGRITHVTNWNNTIFPNRRTFPEGTVWYLTFCADVENVAKEIAGLKI